MIKNKKYIYILFCVSILLLILAVCIPAVINAEKSVEITCNGNVIDNLSLNKENKEILLATAKDMESPSYQWQILLDHKNYIWVNIYDKKEAECEMSYAVVKNMLDDADSTYIRCAATSGEETVYSNAVCVTINPDYQPISNITTVETLPLPDAFSVAEKPRSFSMLRADVTEYVTITIKYLDDSSLDGEESSIYSPYVATIIKGSAFNQSVVSPTFIGFAPYLDSNSDNVITDEDESATTLNLSYSSVDEDIVINVYYHPIEVNFAVAYFFQNINDDLYTEDPSRYHTAKAETGTIVSNAYLESHAGNTTGFTKMYHIPESVAADGSTVFECYYDRNYYLMQFDLAGGYGTDPIYARYGTPFLVNEPIRHGYVFGGWKLVSIDQNNDGVWDSSLPDGISTTLVSVIPEYNCRYEAIWTAKDTTYTVVYWLKNGENNDYLGSKLVNATSGYRVSGEDDLNESTVCGMTEHTHTEECYGNCGVNDHTCKLLCYTDQTLYLADNLTGTRETAFVNLRGQVTSPTEGMVYKYARGYGSNRTYYNFFYYNSTWYYLGTGTEYSGITVTIEYPSANNYKSATAAKKCSKNGHEHNPDCSSCTLTEHTHDNSCKPADLLYYEFYSADQNVLVEGDASTVVNVYYKPKQYTLRFYYAATTGEGTDTDVLIVGGTSYYFGSWGLNTSDDEKLLDNMFIKYSTHIGKVKEFPQLNAEGKSRDYVHGSLTSEAYTYHYIEFTAEYGEDISELWPCSVFESVTIDFTPGSGWRGDQAFVSAWNGEHHVYYSQNYKNETIKGKYEKLDHQLLFDLDPEKGFTDETTVSYLCFWENGARDIKWNIPELYVYNIWVPVLPGESTDGYTTKTYNGVKYKLIDSYDTCDNSDYSEQTQVALEGYIAKERQGEEITLSEEQKKIYDEGWNVHFYYSCEENPLAMKNHDEYYMENENVKYNTALASLDKIAALGEGYIPKYPKTLEENAYYFEGWYTTEQCLPGTKVDLATAKMPSSGVILYANWVPKTHTVKFYPTYDDLLADTNIFDQEDVIHGNIVGNVDTPERTGEGSLSLIFAGWFYFENGQRKAFSPLNMPINKDLQVYAEWSSHSPQPYRIQYVLLSSPETKVADDTTGFAYGGTTRTFNAKAGDPYNQLYSEYNNNYFPIVGSHSITIQVENDPSNLEHNVFTFYYVPATNIEYTVRYVNKETNAVMDSITHTTGKAVVTERFKAYPDMVPDAFYKRLIIEVKWDDEENKYVGTDNNVITFYYTPNKTNAYYAVHFMLEKKDATETQKAEYEIDGTGGYEETGTHIEGIGEIGSVIYISPQDLTGFSLIENSTVPIVYYTTGSGDTLEKAVYSPEKNGYAITITESGTELYFFYERNEYPYIVHYYKYNTTESLYSPKEGSGSYGMTIQETAVEIAGYTCVSDETQTIIIREDDGTQGLNVIIFYYSEVQYVAEYVVVPEEGGWLSSTIEVKAGTEAMTGSVPTAGVYFEFVGWYMDEACTISAASYGTIDPETNRFTPDKSKLSEKDRNIFYAKFVRNAGDLTITRSDATDTTQVFVYKVENKLTGEAIYVTITGNGSTTINNLPLGEYTITQQNDWSWRHTDLAGTYSIENPEGTTIPFSKKQDNAKWLNGNSTLIENKKG